jgi:hypothetical protein
MGLTRVIVVGIVSAGVLVACGGATSTAVPPPVAQGCTVGSGITAHATTKSYIVQLDIGSLEAMYTQAQVDSQHPMGGEVMLRGQMSAVGGPMAGMPDAGGTGAAPAHHLEAHICSKGTGAVIQDANPTITLVNDTTKSAPQAVQIAVMQGVGAGVGDLHYGNNVVLDPGAAYTVTVAVNGEMATLHVQMPAAATGAGTPTTVTGSPTTMGGMPGMP